MTYGGYWAALPAAKIARRLGATTVFYLCNFAYERRDLFAEFNSIVVPSEFAKSFYKKRLDVDSFVLPPLLDESKIIASENSRRFLTFVNPSPEKGVYFFVGIARELNRLRPDIPILIVESRGNVGTIASIKEAQTLKNLNVMSNVSEPKNFYRQTRVLTAPSLWNESFGRVAIEAALNDVPVVCSNRGARLEVAEKDELMVDIPSRFTPVSRIVPTVAEVAPWIQKIVALWDDERYAKKMGENARRFAIRYSFQNVAEQTAALFERFARRSKLCESDVRRFP